MVLGAAALGLLLLVAGAAYFLVGSHHAPPAFALSTPAVQPSNSLAGKWKVATGSEVGYRVRFEQRVAFAPGFGEYPRMTSRQIPVMVLERIG